MGEEALVADRADPDVVHLVGALGFEALPCDRLEVDGPARPAERLAHLVAVVVGPEAEVQRRVRPVRHAAVAGREQDAAAVELEPQVVAHLIAFWSRSLTAAGSYPLNAATSSSSRPSMAPSSLRSRAR